MTNRPQPSTVVDKAAWDDLIKLDEHGENLTPWEIQFVDSLFRWLRGGKWLSEKQSAALQDIMAQRMK